MSKWEDDLKLVKEAYPDLGEEFGSTIDGIILGSASVGMDLYDKMTLPKTFGSTSPADLYKGTGHIRTYPERFGEGLMERDTSGVYVIPSHGEEAIRDFYMSDDDGMAGPAVPPGSYPHYSKEPPGEAVFHDEDEWRRMVRETYRRPAPVAPTEVSPYIKTGFSGEDALDSTRTTESWRGELSDEEAARFMAERDLSGIGIISPPIRTDATDPGFVGKLKDMGSSSMPVYDGPDPDSPLVKDLGDLMYGPVSLETPRTLYSPFREDVSPPEPYERKSFGEKFDKKHPGRREKMDDVKYIFGEEEGSATSVYEPEVGLERTYELYDGYGRPFVIGPSGKWEPKELVPLLYEHWEARHDRGEDAAAAKRDAEIAKYWGKVDSYTKKIEDYIKSSGITAEEYSKRSTAASPLKSEYVKDHPDYEELVREAVPTLDERLDVPDVRTYTPAAGGEVDPSLVDSIISTAAAGGTPGLSEALAAAEREGYEKEGLETSTPLTDLALWTVGGGALGAGLGLGKKLYDSAKLLTGKFPGTAVPSKVYKDAIDATVAGATGVGKKLGAPVGERKGILGPILGHLSKDVDVLSSLAMGSGKTGKLAYRISDSTKKGVLSKVAKDLHGESTDVTRRRVVDTLRREIGDTHDLSTPEKVTTYLTAMLKSSGGKVGEYARKVDGVDSFADIGVRRAMTDVGKETFGSLPRAVGLGATGGAIGGAYLGGASDIAFGSTGTPYADPYPGMIDPTFEPSAPVHYSDILKHFDTETVPGHLPMDTTDTPPYAEIMGESYKYDPAMSPPSAYSYPGFIPSSPFSTAPYSPPGYSPITGSFYPTAAEIIAAGGTTP